MARHIGRIAIVGGGIGGLTLALALRQRGLDAEIYEQAAELSEIGAAVALSANATRELRRLGLLDGVLAASISPTELIYRDGRTGRIIASYPLGRDGRYAEHFGAPYLGIHRADLQRVLGGALAGAGLHLGHRLREIEERGGRVALAFDNGRTVEADAVIGADGVRSRVRAWIAGQEGVRYSATSAFRGIVPQERLPTLLDRHAIQFWMGPNAHLLHYAIGSEGQDVNFFAVEEGPAAWPDPARWVIDAAPGAALAPFAGWHPAVTEMVSAGWVTKRWGLFVVQQPRRWHRGRVVLIGDAAHGMLPHQGQGANTTVEDAITLADLLPAALEGGWDAAMARYEALRRTRTRMIQRASWAANAAYHEPDGPGIAARDERTRHVADDFGWIHALDALETVRAT
jgi:salicylate hydroxylase